MPLPSQFQQSNVSVPLSLPLEVHADKVFLT